MTTGEFGMQMVLSSTWSGTLTENSLLSFARAGVQSGNSIDRWAASPRSPHQLQPPLKRPKTVRDRKLVRSHSHLLPLPTKPIFTDLESPSLPTSPERWD